MPPPVDERFKLEVRLGRDGDIEEWLATDTHLDHPVLIRLLGPDTSPERRAEFVAAVRAACVVSHPHLAAVYRWAAVVFSGWVLSNMERAPLRRAQSTDALTSDRPIPWPPRSGSTASRCR